MDMVNWGCVFILCFFEFVREFINLIFWFLLIFGLFYKLFLGYLEFIFVYVKKMFLNNVVYKKCYVGN